MEQPVHAELTRSASTFPSRALDPKAHQVPLGSAGAPVLMAVTDDLAFQAPRVRPDLRDLWRIVSAQLDPRGLPVPPETTVSLASPDVARGGSQGTLDPADDPDRLDPLAHLDLEDQATSDDPVPPADLAPWDPADPPDHKDLLDHPGSQEPQASPALEDQRSPAAGAARTPAKATGITRVRGAAGSTLPWPNRTNPAASVRPVAALVQTAPSAGTAAPRTPTTTGTATMEAPETPARDVTPPPRRSPCPTLSST